MAGPARARETAMARTGRRPEVRRWPERRSSSRRTRPRHPRLRGRGGWCEWTFANPFSVEGEQATGLRQGFGQCVRSEHHLAMAGPDPDRELAVLYARVRDLPVARPELGDAERRLLRADHDHVDVVQDWP